MKKLLFIVLFGVLALGCENLLPKEQSPNSNMIFVTDSNDAYIIEVAGGELVVTITTNVDYSVVIPEEAKSWLSVADTRAEARMEKLTFIIAENDMFETRLANVEFVDGDGKVLKTILFSQKCDDKVFTTDAEGNYIVIADGGEVQVAVTTNLEYSIAIPEDAQEWLSVADTRVEVREETLTFIVAENKESEERSASIELVDNNGNLLQTVEFIQLATGVCPSNEIWYVNGSTTEPTKPSEVDAFGVNIISNTYDAEMMCWIIMFDGDVTTIGEYAFQSCSSLTSVTIPYSVTTIEYGAFRGCCSLTSITIPDSVTTIEGGVFADCSSLTLFNGKYASEDGRCLIIGGTLNSFAPAGLTEYAIPDGVTTIGVEVFAWCESLTSITIPDSVTTIGMCAFEGCSSLTSVTIPDSVTTIGGWIFSGCHFLTSVTIGDSVTTIGEWIFSGCHSLTSVTIGDSVTTIGWCAFNGCHSLTSVIIPESVTTIGDNAFYGCSSLTSVTIPDSVTTIGASVFCGCSSLTLFNGKYTSEDGRCLIVDGTLNSFAPAGLIEYTIPDSVTTIGDCAFIGCSSLTSITIPESVTTIGDNAFKGCSGLTSITIPNSVITIGEEAFYGCTGELVVNCNIPSASNYLYGAFCGCTFTSVIIGDSVTEIGDYAFYYCRSLISVTIPDSITIIGMGAFYACDSLTSITIPDSVTEIGDAAFYYCRSLISVTIPDSITTIGMGAFYACDSLTSITIPDSVTSIGGWAFSGCSSLTKFNGRYASDDGRCLIIDGIFNSFAPAGLTEYTIPDSVTEIGDYVFFYCDSLTSVTIPDSVTTIGEGAFIGCRSLTSLYCKATTPPAGGEDMFSGNAYGRKIYVPTESVEAYKSAEYWSFYADDIVGYDF